LISKSVFAAFVLIGIASFLIGGCGGGSESGEKLLPEITGTTQEKILLIAGRVTYESEGLVTVAYAETPRHQNAAGQSYYGVHYNMFVTKRADLITQQDKERVRDLAGRLFQLTTIHVLAREPDFSHMGVQVFDPDAWFVGGHERGSVRIFIAQKTTLLTRTENNSLEIWLRSASETEEVIISSGALEELIRQLNEARKGK